MSLSVDSDHGPESRLTGFPDISEYLIVFILAAYDCVYVAHQAEILKLFR